VLLVWIIIDVQGGGGRKLGYRLVEIGEHSPNENPSSEKAGA